MGNTTVFRRKSAAPGKWITHLDPLPRAIGEPMCILIVEDEWLTLQNAYDGVADAGHQAMTAMSGQEALQILATYPVHFTVLVTDYTMLGDVTGADLVVRMRESYPAIPMILTTALSGSVTKAWLHKHAVQLLPKPYRLSSLVAMINAGLAGGI